MTADELSSIAERLWIASLSMLSSAEHDVIPMTNWYAKDVAELISEIKRLQAIIKELQGETND